MAEMDEDGWAVFIPSEEKKINLDKKDLILIDALRENSRTSLNVLSQLVRLSKGSVLSRMQRLEKYSIIYNYFTLVNIHNLGYNMVSIAIKTKMTLAEKESYLNKLKKIPFLTQIITFYSAEWDLMVRVYFKDKAHLDKIINDITNFSNISDIEILYFDIWYVNLKKHFFNQFDVSRYIKKNDISFQKLLTQKKNIEIKYDKKDFQILYHLARNSRASLVEIGGKVRLSPDAISYRIKRLIQGNAIEVFSCSINPYLFSFIPYLFNLQIFKRQEVNSIINYILKNSLSTGVLLYTSSWNLQATILVKNAQELKDFEERLVKEFGNIIHNYEILQIKEQPYFEFFPKEFVEFNI